MIKRFLESREVRKFRQNRLAIASLAVILVYLAVGFGVGILGIISLADTTARVGPDSTPGFFGSQSAEKRMSDCEFQLDRVDTALKKSNAVRALGDIRFGELKVATADLPALSKTVETAWAIYDELAEVEDLDHELSLLPKLGELETLTAGLYDELDTLGTLKRQTRLLLGTDRQGRSILVRAVYSIKVALQIGAVTAFISVFIGSLLGSAAAFFGGWVDHIVIWLYSTFSSIPNLVLLTVLVYMFTGSVFDGTLVPVYAAFCMTFWIGPCRVIRGETLRLKELEYVQAATAIGFGRFYILIKHVLPNTAHLILINFSLLFIGAIKSEVILSFLGLGVKKGASWGIMIHQSGQEVINGFFWQIGAATFFMVCLVLAFNILSDALQDAFDPKHVT